MSGDIKDYLANERTFLAWVRTSIGIMAFGFVIEKFALFIKEMILLQTSQDSNFLSPSSISLVGYSSYVGSFLIALGTIISLLSFIQFKNVTKQINDNTYQPSMLLSGIVTVSMIFIGVFLLIYLR